MSAGPITIVTPRPDEVEVIPLSEMEWVLPKVFRFFFDLVAFSIGVIIVLVLRCKKKEKRTLI